MRTKGIIALLLVCFCLCSSVYAKDSFILPSKVFRAMEKKVERKFTEEEKQIAEFVFTFYCAGLGYETDAKSIKKTIKSLTKEQYAEATTKSADIAINPIAKGLLKTGKAGERILKGLVNSFSSTEENK